MKFGKVRETKSLKNERLDESMEPDGAANGRKLQSACADRPDHSRGASRGR